MKFRTISATILLVLATVCFVATANAQITITGPSTGFCTSQQALSTSVTPTHPFIYPLYGAGQLTDPNCGGAPSTFAFGISDEAIFAAGNTEGFDIVGAGNLQGFLIRVNKGSGAGFTAHVWIKHSDGTTSPSFVINCGAGTNTPVTPVPDCTDSTTIVPVIDHDKIMIFVSGSPGDTYQDIHWYLGKT